ncbi:MAG: ribose-5-phosphate isomerase RpiA [Methylophilaceae bacterium]
MSDKALVASHAANLVENGMIVGLGTGSTANFFIEALAKRHAEGLDVTTVASSYISAIKAKEAGLPLIAIEQLTELDLYVDGADEVSPDLALLKGRGSDLVREKLLATASKQFIVLVDESKLVNQIGEQYPIPIEVMPFAWQLVKQHLANAGATGTLRPNASKDGLAMTSHGSLVLEMVFNASLPPAELNHLLNNTPGVVEHGLFYKLASTVFIVHDGKIETRHA